MEQFRSFRHAASEIQIQILIEPFGLFSPTSLKALFQIRKSLTNSELKLSNIQIEICRNPIYTRGNYVLHVSTGLNEILQNLAETKFSFISNPVLLLLWIWNKTVRYFSRENAHVEFYVLNVMMIGWLFSVKAVIV